jgi:hypothetical protein
MMEVQHLFYPRTLKGDRRLDGTRNAAEQSQDAPKANIEKYKDVRELTQFCLTTLWVSVTPTPTNIIWRR